MDLNSISNNCVRPDYYVGADEDIVSDICSWIDHRRRVNSRLKQLHWVKENQRAGKREIGILRAQYRNICTGDFRIFADVDRRSASGVHSRGVARVGQKSYLAQFSLIESGGSFYFYIRIV